jgi:dienelactone hydrolase
MDAFVKKRKAPADAVPKVRPTFVVCPGAGGGDCAPLTQALATFGKTCTIDRGRWAGNFPSQMGANVQLVVDAARRASTDGAPVILVGHSFGCRVVADLLKSEAVPTPSGIQRLPANVVTSGAILESYPLYGTSPPKPATDREAALRSLPPKCRVLFLSGAKDEFLDRARQWRSGQSVGEAALKAVLAESPCDATIVMVAGARHSAFKVAKATSDTVRRTNIATLKAHIFDRLLAPAPAPPPSVAAPAAPPPPLVKPVALRPPTPPPAEVKLVPPSTTERPEPCVARVVVPAAGLGNFMADLTDDPAPKKARN